MRSAEQALKASPASARGSSPVGLLAFGIAHWRRLSGNRFSPQFDDLVVALRSPLGIRSMW